MVGRGSIVPVFKINIEREARKKEDPIGDVCNIKFNQLGASCKF